MYLLNPFYATFTNPFLVAFLLLPPILIARRKPTLKTPLITAGAFFVLFGWGCLVIGYEYDAARLAAQINSMSNPPQELVDALTQDASRITVYMFGWIFAVVYLLAWETVFFLFKSLLRLFPRR